MTKVIARVHPVHLINVSTSAWWPPTPDQANRLELLVRRKLAAIVESIIAIVIITQPVS